jgi:hypothetical protein
MDTSLNVGIKIPVLSSFEVDGDYLTQQNQRQTSPTLRKFGQDF